jgi:sugar phosphate permease
MAQVKKVLKLPAVWLLMMVVLCAYVGYKITDIFPQYAYEIMHYHEVQSAGLGTFLLYLRPIAGIGVGFLADRSRPSIWVTIGFAAMLAASIMMASGLLLPSGNLLFLLTTLCMGLGVYAARALYFAVMQEVRIPLHLTGTAVGVISAIGYTPDIFVGPLTGYFLDTYEGMQGFQFVFGSLAVFSMIGLACGYAVKLLDRIEK